MLVLALDTTVRTGSAALLSSEGTSLEATGDPASTHGQRLPLDLVALLERAGAGVNDVDLFAVAAGPGSFTGLRIGIAAVQGLAMATGRRVVAVSALDALALAAPPGQPGTVVAWMDAQRGQVYAAEYRADGERLSEPTALSPDETIDRLRARIPEGPLGFVGDGAVRYASTIEARLGSRATVDPVVPPLALTIARMALAHPERAVLPHAIVPIYVRRPDAELARERRASSGA